MTRPLGTGDHIVIVDGSAVVYRAYFAGQAGQVRLTRPSDGMPTGAIFGVAQSLWTLMTTRAAIGRPFTHMAFVLDAPGPNFRHELLPSYKANRHAAPSDLTVQRPYIERAVAAFGVRTIKVQGFEADDAIATLARKAAIANADVSILTSDKDLACLVEDGCVLIDPAKRYDEKDRIVGVEAVIRRFGVRPQYVPDFLALTGDAGDNIPGVPGIGAVKAAKLLNEYGDLEAVLANAVRARALVGGKCSGYLQAYATQARFARQLVQLRDDVPLPFELDDLDVEGPDCASLLEYLRELEFTGFAQRVLEYLQSADNQRASLVPAA